MYNQYVVKRRDTLSPDDPYSWAKQSQRCIWLLSGYLTYALFLFLKNNKEVDSIKQTKNQTGELVNENIPNVKLLFIDDEGNKIGVISRAEAMRYADEKELDLVVVSPNSSPMVAKLMDYSKYRYEQQRKLREIKKNQKIVELKEIRLSPTIDKHDFDTKLRQSQRFLEKGNKVKLSIRFRGRMITHKDVGSDVIDKFIEALGDLVVVEAKPKMEGRSMIAVVAPVEKK